MSDTWIGTILETSEEYITDSDGNLLFSLLPMEGGTFNKDTRPKLYAKLGTETLGNLVSESETVTYKIIAEYLQKLGYTVDGNVVAFINPTTGVFYFGDGESSSTNNPSHTYVIHGNYAASFESSGGVLYDVESVNIVGLPLPDAGMLIEEGYPDSNVITVTGTGGVTSKITMEGIVYDSPATHEYTLPEGHEGSYPYLIECSVLDEFGNGSYVEEYYDVWMPNVLPTGTFSFLRNTLTVSFTSSIDDEDGENGDIKYFWEFGDGVGTSNERNPVYTYGAPNPPSDENTVSGENSQTFTVTLTARDTRNDDVVITKDVTVYDYEATSDNFVVNGDLSTDDTSFFTRSSATATLSGGLLTVTSTSGSSGRIEIPITGMTIGRQYKVTLGYYSGSVSNQSMKNITGFTTNPSVALQSTTATESITYLISSAETGLLRLYAGTSGNVLYLTNILFEEIL
jgi:PKD repeat protein